MNPLAGCAGSQPGRTQRLLASRLAHGLMLLLGLLAFCGVALANEGRLILVSGEVRLQRTVPGQPVRSLVPENGTVVTAGDALVTGADGRVQIAFSDGSLLSLQPRSEFRIDDYRFDLETQRGFFQLVRGALRTISGAIGKRQPDDYRMSTPTASIGIRGTEFVVEETVCDPACRPGRTPGLRVAVSAGRVVVYNAAGSIEVAAGEATYVAGPSSVPVPTSERPTLSTAPASFDPGTPRLAQAGSVSGPEPERNSRATRESGEGLPPGLLSDWRSGPLASAGNAGVTPADVIASPLPLQADPRARSTPAKSGRIATGPTRPSGVEMTPEAGGTGGTAPSDSSPVDFNRPTAQPKVAAADDDEAGAEEDEEAQGTGTDGPAGPAGPIAGDVLSPSGDGMITIPVNNAPAAAEQRNPDGTPIVVVAAGDCRDLSCQPGAGVDNGGGSDGGGSGSGGGNNDGGGNDGGGNDGEPPPVLTPGLNSAARVSVRTLQSPWLDVSLNAANSHVHLDSEYRLESIGLCPTLLCISRGTASVVESGHTADLAWGRWVNGTARVSLIGLESTRKLGANNGMHYLVGVPTVTMPTSGTAYYAVAGATSPTFASGAVAPGSFTGQGLVQFAAGLETRIGFKGDMTFGSGEHYHVFSNGARLDSNGRLVEIGDSQIRMTGRTTFSGSLGVVSVGGGDRLGCAGGHCQAKVDGGFYGPNAASMGVGYSVGKPGGGDTINGVAVLHRR